MCVLPDAKRKCHGRLQVTTIRRRMYELSSHTLCQGLGFEFKTEAVPSRVTRVSPDLAHVPTGLEQAGRRDKNARKSQDERQVGKKRKHETDETDNRERETVVTRHSQANGTDRKQWNWGQACSIVPHV